MNWLRRSQQLLILVVTGFALPTASLAQVRVLMSGGFSAAYQELMPQFQNTTGITVTIGAQLRRGVPADMVIMSRGGLAELMTEGRIVLGSDVDLARVPLGVAVRAGTPKPDIRSVAAFKQSLLRAKSVGSQSSTTVYIRTRLLAQLGIESAMAGKLANAGPASVATGEVEMVLAPVSEVLPIAGVDLVGTIPNEIQFVQTFAAALLKGTKEPEASKRLIAFLASETATPAIEKMGMNRPALRRP
jgi:molybdate transport system substrate-binding protein